MILKAELHSHTLYSPDSRLKPKEVVKLCQKKGINCLAVTDHDEIKGAIEVRKIAPFKVIISQEIMTRDGELIGYFINEKIPPGLNPQETIKLIRDQGGLVSIPHPFDYLRKTTIKKLSLYKIINLIDLVEIFNSRYVFNKDNVRAKKLCQEYNKIPVVGSDAHTRFEIGSAYVQIDDFNTPQEFFENLKKGSLVYKKSPFWVHLISKFYKLKN